MADEFSKGMIYQKLKEMRDALEKDFPVKGQVNIMAAEGVLTHEFIRLYYNDGVWLVHFAVNAPTISVAAIMKIVLGIVDVEVGRPFYYSNTDMKVYIGQEAGEKFIDDISVSLLEDSSSLKN